MYPENESLNQSTEPDKLAKNTPKLEKFAKYLKQDGPEDSELIVENNPGSKDVN
jgi:hypothetical protein